MESRFEKYFRDKEELLKREAELSRGALALPDGWEASKETRCEKACNDFFFFAKTYFPDWFPVPFHPAHRRMIADALRQDRALAIYAAPRGFGKTMLFRAFKLWAIIYGKRMHIGQVSDTIDLSSKDLSHLRTELKYNPYLVADYGPLIGGVDNAYEFEIERHRYNVRGARITAYSATVTARGALFHGSRPDLFLFDDFEDFATSINEEISKFKLDVIERDFLPALAETGSAVLLGNNARTTCIINILTEMSDVDRAALHPAAELNIIDAWDETHNRPLWHQRYQFASEDAMREAMNVSPSVWNAEFRQKPMPPEGARFRLEHWQHYDALPNDAKGIMFCDPAFGESSDDKAIAVLLWSKSKRKFYAPDSFTRQCGWKEYFEAMYAIYAKWQRHIMYVGWEGDFGQAQYLEFRNVYKELADKPSLPIRIIDVKQWGDKPTRIEKLEFPFSRGEILFSPEFLKSRDGITAQAQMIGYDGKKTATRKLGYIDALASCWNELFHLTLRPSGTSGGASYRVGGERHNRRW